VSKNAASIAILVRSPEKLRACPKGGNTVTGHILDAHEYTAECDVLINTTPLGMRGINEDFADLSFIKLLPRGAVVCDLIYDPPQTALLAEAKKNGLQTMNGLPMLVFQAFYAFGKFFGILPGKSDYQKSDEKINRTRLLY
jgi:shikimate dehydrogenase